MNTDLIQKKRWGTSLQRSIAIHVLLLLLAFLIRPEINPEEKIEAQYAVTVSFEEVRFDNSRSSNSTKSQATSGAQRQKSEAPRKIETPSPAKVPVPTPTPPKPTPQPTSTPTPTAVEPTDPVISETTVEESDIQAVEEPMEVEEPEPEYIPQESSEPEITEEPVVITNPEYPSLDDIIADINDDPIEMEEEGIPEEEAGSGSSTSSTTGSSDLDPSIKDGDADGSGRGNSGDGKGSDISGNDDDSGIGSGGYGEGEFDDSGDGIFGRKPIYIDPNMKRVASAKSGKIAFKVCINRRGIVSYIEIDEFKTTIDDSATLRKAMESMRKYKYEPDPSAPKEQCGTFTVIVDNYQGIAPRSGR